MKTMITGKELREIKTYLVDCEKDLKEMPPWWKKLHEYAGKMHTIINNIRECAHYTEDAEGFTLGVAEMIHPLLAAPETH